MKKTATALLLLCAMVLSLGFLVSPASGQVPMGPSDIIQNGRVVGHIYVTPHNPEQFESYEEHWVLSDRYRRDGTPTIIVPATRAFRSLDEFMAEAEKEWRPGYRYVHVGAAEYPDLPRPAEVDAVERK